MNTFFDNINKNLQSIISSYHDVNTIFLKLENEGYIKKMTNLLGEIFHKEHKFTISGFIFFIIK